ncbi:MAG: hypothetical protein JSV35_03120, partial [Candidatus Bathyarchaeota archaeon]
MGAEKSTIHVKMKVGDVEFEVDCRVEELRNVVDEVLDAVSQRSAGNSFASLKQQTGELTGRGETCKGVILNLWREGWFSTAHGLGEVHGEMGRRGFHYDRTAVAHALVDLVREGVLTRVGRPRRYQYLQKRPPQAGALKTERE